MNAQLDYMPSGVPDTIWPSDNEYDIPSLSIEQQADAFDLPVNVWGATRQKKSGTYIFYTADYRFRAIWQNPNKLLEAGCVNVVEPNFSVYEQSPLAHAIWQTYKKRWLSRYWQSQGIRVFVDLNVAINYALLNLFGVPVGWRSYATRGYSDRLQALGIESSLAKRHAESDDILLLVYGGGKKVKGWCKENNAVWIPESRDLAKGLYMDELSGKNGGLSSTV